MNGKHCSENNGAIASLYISIWSTRMVEHLLYTHMQNLFPVLRGLVYFWLLNDSLCLNLEPDKNLTDAWSPDLNSCPSPFPAMARLSWVFGDESHMLVPVLYPLVFPLWLELIYGLLTRMTSMWMQVLHSNLQTGHLLKPRLHCASSQVPWDVVVLFKHLPSSRGQGSALVTEN